MRSLNERSSLRVGVIGAAIIAVLVLGSTAFGTVGLGDTRYQAELANAGGVRPGDEVRIAGIGVGRVTATRLEGDRVIMSFRAENDVRLGEATRLAVKLSTLLGGRYVELTPRGAGELPDNRIRLSHTSVPYDLQAAVEAGTPALEQLDGAKLRESLKAVTDAFGGTDPKVAARTLDGLTAISRIITEREGQIGELLDSAHAISGTLNENDARVFRLMGQSDRLLTELLERRALITGILRDFRDLSGQLRALLEENRPAIKPLLSNLRGVADILARNDKAIARSLKLLAPGARYLNNAVGNGPYLELNLPYGIFPDNLLCATQAVRGCR